MPPERSVVDQEARDSIRDLKQMQKIHEAVCEQWRETAMRILEETREANARSRDDIAASIKEFVAAQTKMNADLYDRINRGDVQRAGDRGVARGAAAIIGAASAAAVTLFSAIIGWPHHN